MTWQKTCDSFSRNSKVRRAGPKGHNLWHMTAVECALADTDGFVDPFLLHDTYGNAAWLKTPAQLNPVVAKLVEVGLWHDASTVLDCARCAHVIAMGPENPGRSDAGLLRDGWFYFHDWSDYALDKAGKNDPLHRRSEKRRQDLNRRAEQKRVKAEVQARDEGMCRYCAVRVRWSTGKGDQKSEDIGTIDHLDPWDFSSGPAKDGNSMANCVVACRRCNGDKGQRTPQQWLDEDPDARTLLPPPKQRRRLERSEPSEPDRVQIESESDPGIDSPSRGARLRAGSGPLSGPASVRAGSGRVALGLVPGGGS